MQTDSGSGILPLKVSGIPKVSCSSQLLIGLHEHRERGVLNRSIIFSFWNPNILNQLAI